MKYRYFFLMVAITLAAGCGGGGSGSSDRPIFQGTLTERENVDDGVKALVAKHSAGERIGEVKICLQSTCSITDDKGQWGFEAPQGYSGGPTTLSVNGHGIATTVEVTIPQNAKEVTIDFGHLGEHVVVEHLDVDGSHLIDSDAHDD